MAVRRAECALSAGLNRATKWDRGFVLRPHLRKPHCEFQLLAARGTVQLLASRGWRRTAVEKRLRELLDKLSEEPGIRLRYDNELLIRFPEEMPTVEQRLALAEEILADPNRREVGQRWEEQQSLEKKRSRR